MKAEIRDFAIDLELGVDVTGLPDRIIIRPEESDNDMVWIYTLTEVTTYDKIPPRLINELPNTVKEKGSEGTQ